MTETPNISTMESRIRQSYASLSQAERKLADVVLSRQREVLGYSATELASLAGTSKSSAARSSHRWGAWRVCGAKTAWPSSFTAICS